jgi:aryl-alcohol dehydrogenase-like predicted oxidoreductase
LETKQLGNSDLKITPIGFGAWAIGGEGYRYSWGPQDDQQSVRAIHRFLERGVNWIDTAPGYGKGHSEEIVARAMAEWPAPRPYVFTKCGLRWDAEGMIFKVLTPGSIRSECEDSLRRLKVEAIDMLQIHWPTDDDEEVAKALETLAGLQREGKVRWIGVSNFTVRQMKMAKTISPVTSLQPPYSLIRREIEAEVLPYCKQEGIGVIAYSPMYSGLLTGAMTRERAACLPDNDWRKRDPEFNEPGLSRNLTLVECLTEIGKRHGRTPGEVAIAWTLRDDAVTGAIVGGRSPEQVDGVMGAADLQLSAEELSEIDQVLSIK